MGIDFTWFSTTLVKEMADAVIYADAKGEIQVWNKGAEHIFGFTQSEAIGQSLDIIIPVNLRKRHWEGYENTMRTGQSHYAAGDLLAVPATTKDGTRISIEFTVLPFSDESGQMVGIAAILRDVTKQFAQTRALRKELAELKAQSPLK